jgi:hypothetical protein
MSSSTSLLDLLVQAQATKEVTANNLFNAESPATLFARRESQCTGLNWYYYGGYLLVDGVLTSIANNASTLLLTASQNNYIEATRSGVVSCNQTGFTAGRIPLYMAVTGASTVTSYTDYRAFYQPRDMTSKATVTFTSADATLTADQARAKYLTTAGAITGANRNVVVPNDWEGVVFCNNTGAFTTTIKTSAGTGVVVAQGKRAVLFADGTDVVRVTADV